MFSPPARQVGHRNRKLGERCSGRAGWRDSLLPSRPQGPLLHLTQQVVWLVPPSCLSCAYASPLVLWDGFMLPPALNQGEEVNVGIGWCCWQQPARLRAGSPPPDRLSSPRHLPQSICNPSITEVQVWLSVLRRVCTDL